MAKATGVSLTSVQRIWRAHGLAPHRIRTFKLSNDPKFAAKVRDIVGLYVDPPAHAVVLSVALAGADCVALNFILEDDDAGSRPPYFLNPMSKRLAKLCT